MAKIAPQINKKRFRFWSFIFLLALLIFCPEGVCTNKTRENDVVKVVRKCSPAVANISSQYEIRKKSNPFSSYGIDPMLEKFFQDFFSPELERREQRTSLGSGVVIDGIRGLVLTNTHVIDKATSIRVALNDQREFDASIVGMDPDSDLAVLRIHSKQRLPSIEMGNSDDLMIGESVIAIGNPFGFSHTVTTGVVSAVNRSIKTSERVFHEFVQTDASINPGNSGGPLLNIDGELIGINTAIYAQAQGIGFAIPINRAKRIVSDLIKYGAVVPAWIGLTVQTIDIHLAEYLNLSEETGVIVSAVEHDSPAEKAGIKDGDVILSVNGFKITDLLSYDSKIKEISSGQSILLEKYKKGKKIRVSLKTGKFPRERSLALAKQRLGITISDLDVQTRKRYGIRARSGVLILKLRQGSHLDRIGVAPGDIIRQINEDRVDRIVDFEAAFVKYRNNPSLNLLIQRGNHLYPINAIMKD